VAHRGPPFRKNTGGHRGPPRQKLQEDIRNLIAETKKQLEHLRVLGVEGIQVTAETAPVVVAPRPERTSLFGDIAPAPVKLTPSTETFEQIHAEIGDCTRCPLHLERTHVVHTEGDRKARLMFVGEAPGADEDIQSRPFVGRAGQLLTKIIEAIGLKREEVLIGNVNRCRPPGNRAPTTEEATTCKPYLLREIAIVQPKVIVVLGNTAMKNLLDTREGITRLRGRFQDYKGIKVMPTFHPAYLLRDPSKKRETWEDLKKVRDYLDSQ
jgi:uracil-DNA glycosylase family 4